MIWGLVVTTELYYAIQKYFTWLAAGGMVVAMLDGPVQKWGTSSLQPSRLEQFSSSKILGFRKNLHILFLKHGSCSWLNFWVLKPYSAKMWQHKIVIFIVKVASVMYGTLSRHVVRLSKLLSLRRPPARADLCCAMGNRCGPWSAGPIKESIGIESKNV